MNAQGILTFQNIPVAAPVPPSVGASEGLIFQAGDVKLGDVLGEDIAAFTTDRNIKTNGFGLFLRDAFPENSYLQLNPAFVEITDTGGGTSVLNTSQLFIGNLMGTASVNMSGLAGLFVESFDPAAQNPQMSLVNSKYAGTAFGIYVEDNNAGVPFIDEFTLVDNTGFGLRFGTDNISGINYFGFGFQSSRNPAVNDFFWMDNADADSMSYMDQRFDSGKYAMTIQNLLPGGNRSLLVRSESNQLVIQTTDTGGTSVSRESFMDSAGVVRGYTGWDESLNVMRLQGTNDVRIMQGATDRIRCAGSQNYLNTNTRAGALTGAATARIHIIAQTAAAGTAPLKFDSSATLLTTPENGAFEYDGTNLYFTTGGVRRTVMLV